MRRALRRRDASLRRQRTAAGAGSTGRGGSLQACLRLARASDGLASQAAGDWRRQGRRARRRAAVAGRAAKAAMAAGGAGQSGGRGSAAVAASAKIRRLSGSCCRTRHLEPVQVVLGVTDFTFTAMSKGSLQPGDDLVIGQSANKATTAQTQIAQSGRRTGWRNWRRGAAQVLTTFETSI